MDDKKSDLIGDIDEIHGLSSSPSPSHQSHNSLDSNSSLKTWNISNIRNNKQRSLIISQLKRYKIRDPIILNIGGIKYCTSINTLLKYEDSLFYKMFSTKYLIKPSKDKSFFIDRDGTHFGKILNYLRTGHLIIDKNDEISKKEMLLEVQYYQIESLINILNPKVDSVILSEFNLNVLESWISMELLRNSKDKQSQNQQIVSFPKLCFKLLYRGSKHGFAASAFHRRCDHKKNTLVVVSANDTIFGGFTCIPWESSNVGRAVDQIITNAKSKNTFSFFLESSSAIWKSKYNLNKSEKWDYCGSNQVAYVKNPCYSVYHHMNFGPVFGYRPCFDYDGDLCGHIIIGDGCDKKLNSRIDSFVGEKINVRKHMTDSFFVYDYEVFQVNQM